MALLEDLKAGNKYLERLVIKASGRIYFLETSEIDWIEAAKSQKSETIIHRLPQIPQIL
ncbi:MAG: hypothetical protein ACRD8U_02185 [Pyrinomonadaceae bacterium]